MNLEQKLSEMAEKYTIELHGKIIIRQDIREHNLSKSAFKAGFSAALELTEVLGLVAALEGLRKEAIVGFDGTKLKCTCRRDDCIEFMCSSGDEIYVNSYANSITPEQALSTWKAFKENHENTN